jgi:heterotetrameric sarcosine oxidase delta subunit
MSFLLRCPHCGDRSVYEFRYGGEVKDRPGPSATEDDWFRYTYIKANEAGVQKEWWYHRAGCLQWIVATRNTITSQVLETSFPEDTP